MSATATLGGTTTVAAAGRLANSGAGGAGGTALVGLGALLAGVTLLTLRRRVA